MAGESPSSILSRAAALIRDTAAKVTPAPWNAGSVDEETGRFFGLYGDFGWTVHGPSGTAELEDTERGLADCRWIALMSPAVAPALERILRDAAKSFDVESKIFTPEGMAKKVTERRFAGPLALARAVLGEVMPEVDRGP